MAAVDAMFNNTFHAVAKAPGVRTVLEYTLKFGEWVMNLRPYVQWGHDVVAWIRDTLARFHVNLEVVSKVDETLSNIMAFGHQPGNDDISKGKCAGSDEDG